MDKGGDTSRLSGQVKQLSSASDKSKNKKVKRLGSVNNRSYAGNKRKKKSNKCEMGRHVSSVTQLKEEEKQLPSPSQVPLSTSNSNGNNKKSKLPRKQLLDDSNGVYHSSVPRKLRSATRKRHRESMSPAFPDSNKLNSIPGRVEERHGTKKLKLNVKQGSLDLSPNHSFCGPITKDEEEVVEALYALAGMFAHNDTDNKSKLDDPRLSSLPEAGEVCPRPPEVINEEILSRMDKASQPGYGAERSIEAIVTNKLSNDQDLPCSSGGKKLNEELDSSAAQTSLEIRQIKPELYHDPGTLMQPTKPKTSLLDGKPKIALGLTTTPESQFNHLNTATEKNAFWPGSASVSSSGSWSHSSSSRSCAAKLPPWLETALCAMKSGSFQSCSSMGKIPKVDHDRKSGKRCATHLYISHLIQVLKMPKSRDSFSLHRDQTRPNEIMNQSVLLTMSDINGMKSGLNGTRFSSDTVGAFEKHANETARCTLQQRRHFEEQTHTSLVSGAYNSHKQTFNFLSLSAGDSGLEAGDSFKGAKIGLETSTPQVPPSSHMQRSIPTSVFVSQCYPASAYIQQPSADSAPWQAQFQLSTYARSPFHGPHTNTNSLTMQHRERYQQHQEQQQHQEARFWAAQVAAQYRTTGVSTSTTQYRSCENGRPDLPTLIPYNKAGIPPLSSPFELLSNKCPKISEYQQHVMTIASSLPHARAQKRDRLSSVYEDNGGGFQAGATLPLELL